ncbi:MAG: type II toxin-antitoxin system YafQ family toxin [Leptospiraceae bacterium]|nr:type II toxin-antitoxin system YafQ family toxin [Leptospiraceae bacterium]
MRNNDFKLSGSYSGRKKCHIEPDWRLIYKIVENEIIFESTGSHSDLFD